MKTKQIISSRKRRLKIIKLLPAVKLLCDTHVGCEQIVGAGTGAVPVQIAGEDAVYERAGSVHVRVLRVAVQYLEYHLRVGHASIFQQKHEKTEVRLNP